MSIKIECPLPNLTNAQENSCTGPVPSDSTLRGQQPTLMCAVGNTLCQYYLKRADTPMTVPTEPTNPQQ